jgi:hypothetical protein
MVTMVFNVTGLFDLLVGTSAEQPADAVAPA